MDIIFKKAKQTDGSDLHDLQVKVFNKVVEDYSLPSDAITLLTPQILKEKYPDMDFYKAISDNNVIGGVFLRKTDALTCEIYRMFIDPSKQNKGYGSVLIEKIIEEFPECTDFVLDTPCILENNLQFYKNNYFVSQGIKYTKTRKIPLHHLVRKVNRNAITGLKPSDGGLHLGHYVGNICPLVQHQDIYNCSFMFADWQVLNSDIAYYDKNRLINNMRLMLKQMLSLGVKPNKLKILVESQDKTLMLEEFIWLSDFLTDSRIYRVPAIGHVKEQDERVKLSLMCYPILQALDCIIAKADVVFSNIDNKACVELINELFKKVANKGIKDYKPVKIVTGKVDMLVGTDGHKMSKAKGNCIFFTDTDDEIKRKINSMYTDSNRITAVTPGQLDENVVFKYLKVFAPEETYVNLCNDYVNGRISDVYTKEVLIDILVKLFAEYRKTFAGISDSDVNQLLEKYK